MSSRIISEITYATVREYNRFLDELPAITLMSGDLKNFQRPWVVDTILKRAPSGGTLLEIGADRCELAAFLQKQGYRVWVVDTFDGLGGGTAQFDEMKRKFPDLTIIKGFFHEADHLPLNYFDAIYSCSVIEHTPMEALRPTFDTIYRCLTDNGLSAHAIDFTVDGPLLKNVNFINEVLKCNGCNVKAAEVAQQALNDVETFYLTPAGHQRWRKFLGKSYDQYPFRKVTSLNVVTRKNVGTRKNLDKYREGRLREQIDRLCTSIDAIAAQESTGKGLFQSADTGWSLQIANHFSAIRVLLNQDSSLYYRDEKLRNFLYNTFSVNPLIPKVIAGIPCETIQPLTCTLSSNFIDTLKTSACPINVAEFRPDLALYRTFLEQNAHVYETRFANNPLHGCGYFFSKTLEHFITFYLIGQNRASDIMDIGSAGHQYALIVRQAYPGKRVWIQDLCFPEGIKVFDEGFFQVGGSAASIPLSNASIDFVTFHCSIEHFEKDADINCLREIQRILRPGGCAVIIPLHVHDQYTIGVNPIGGPFLDDNFIADSIMPELRQNRDVHICYTNSMVSRFARIHCPVTLTGRLLSKLTQFRFEFYTIEIPDEFFNEAIISDRYFNGAYKRFIPHSKRCFLKLIKQ